jgi:hypothetical protein
LHLYTVIVSCCGKEFNSGIVAGQAKQHRGNQQGTLHWEYAGTT